MAKITNQYYEELAYIESTGTQYIETGIRSSDVNDLRVIGDIMWTGSISDNCLLGMKFTSGDSRRYFIYAYQNKWDLGVGQNYTSNTITINQKYKVESQILSGNSYLNVDDVRLTTLTNSLSTSANYGLTMFCNKNVGALGYYASARVYNMQMYVASTGELIRDFVPARRKDTGAIGLLDIVNNTFYTNSGSGTFSYGLLADVTVDPVNSGTITGTGEYTVGSNVTLTAIPNSGYQFEKWINKEYILLSAIESTGTQWINTNYKPTGNTKLEIVFQLVQTSFDATWGNGVSFVEFSNGGNRFGINVAPSSGINVLCGGKTAIGTIPTDTNWHRIIINDEGKNYIDGNLIGTNVFTGTSSYNLPIFVNSWGGGNTRYIAMKLSEYKLTDTVTGNLIRNFVPVMRQGGLEVGLLDLVEMKFYPNSGTGNFLAYEESTTTQYPSMTNNPLTVSNIINSLILTAQFKKTANCRYKVNGAWKNAMMYIKQNGTWKPGTPKIKINGNWKEGG